jgi:D-alanine-D-alanine ligase
MKVVVLMGGPSSEREVSLVTGRAVSDALVRLGHEVIQVDVLAPGLAPRRDAGGPALLRAGDQGAGRTGARGYLAFLGLPELADCEAVFIALHGEIGEDGKLQAALDLAGLPYTGSGALASALAMNKDISKRIFVDQGIPTPDWLFHSGAGTARGGGRSGGSCGPTPDTAAIDAIGGFPVVVKPNDQGSTIGLTVVEGGRGLGEAVAKAKRYSDEIVVERYIPGRELTVSVLCDEALPVVEIIPEGGLYDYTRKYVKGKSRYVVPAELAGGVAEAAKELGSRAFKALGCRGFGRVDMRLTPGDEIFCLEVNTVPGMTETSLVPMAAGAVGISFDSLVESILRSAAADRPRWRGEE